MQPGAESSDDESTAAAAPYTVRGRAVIGRKSIVLDVPGCKRKDKKGEMVLLPACVSRGAGPQQIPNWS